MGGSALGTLICPGLGTAIGGFLGGLVGGIAGSWGARMLGEQIVEDAYQKEKTYKGDVINGGQTISVV